MKPSCFENRVERHLKQHSDWHSHPQSNPTGKHSNEVGKTRNELHSFFFIRILFLRPRLNILTFLPILGWRYSCNIFSGNYSLRHFHLRMYWGYQLQVFGVHIAFQCTCASLLVLASLRFREMNNFIQLRKNISLYCINRFSTQEIILFSQFQPQVYSWNILKISQNSASIFL